MRDITGKGIQECRFSAARTARNKNVISRFYQLLQELRHLRGDGAIFQQFFHGHRLLGKLSDGNSRTAQCNRRKHHIHTAAIFQTGIHNRICFRDLTVCLANDQIYHTAKLLLIFEMLIHPGQTSLALHKNIIWAIYHDLRDILIRKDRIQQTAKAAVHLIDAVDRIHLLNRKQVASPAFSLHQRGDRFQKLFIGHPGGL